MSEKIISSETPYHNKFAISQSSIKDWKTVPPSKWYKMWVTKELSRPKKTATTLGSFLDCIMFTPTDLEKRFMVSTVALPSEKVQKILEDGFEHIALLNKNAKTLNETEGKKLPMKEFSLEDRDLIMSLCIKNDHFSKKPDQAYNDVVKKGAEYVDFLKTTNGRQVISPADNILALELKEILLTDKVSKGFFIPKKGCEVVFQQRIFAEFELSGFDNLDFLPIKGALDIVHFNHKRKEVREVDLKCTNDAFLFREAVKRFGYVSQHSFYDYLLREWLKTYKEGEYKDYSVMSPINVVIDDDIKVPYLYMYNTNDLQIERTGIENTVIRGWEDTINEIAFHFDSGDWSRPREHIKNGVIHINWYKR